jgi:NAD+ diphosphatase
MDELIWSDGACFLLLCEGCVKVRAKTPLQLAWFGKDQISGATSRGAETVFLGILEGKPRYALIPLETARTADDPVFGVSATEEYLGLFQAGSGLVPVEAQLAAQAIHVANWINCNRFCGSCGAATSAVEGGHKRVCTSQECRREQFPRTDPALLVLVTSGDRCLLARQKKFPPRYYSPLAGFIEPGDTLESAARREIKEEVGLLAGQVRYVGSQPWPFPTSPMFGCIATATTEQIRMNASELEDAVWLDRSDIESMLHVSPGSQPSVLLPPRGLIGRTLIEYWMSMTVLSATETKL